MRFLLDQDVYAVTARLLSSLGHDVVLAGQIGLSQASDSDLLKTAQEQKQILWRLPLWLSRLEDTDLENSRTQILVSSAPRFWS